MTFPASVFFSGKTYLPEQTPSPDPSPQRTWKVPSTGEWLLGKHDFQRPDWYTDSVQYSNGSVSYILKNQSVPRQMLLDPQYRRNPPESALPQTIPMPGEKPSDFVEMNSAWQWTWFNLLNAISQKTKTHDELISAWTYLTRQGAAFTDFHSREYGFADYVLGVNLNSPKGGMQHKSLSCGANLFKKLGTYNNFYVVQALNLLQTPPPVDELIEQPWLVQLATQCTVQRDKTGTKFKVLDFPMLRPFGTPFLLVSTDGTNLVPKDDVIQIDPGSTYSPYVD